MTRSVSSTRSFEGRVKPPIWRFSRTVIREKIRRASGAWLMPARTSSWALVFEMSLPSKVIVPVRGWSSPEIVLRVVVLPAPFAPIRVTISPRRTSSDTPCRAWMWP